MPRPQSGVTLDKATGEVRDEKDVGDGEHAEEDSENDSASLASTHLLERLAVWQLVNDEESENTSGESEVERNQAHSPLEGVLSVVDSELDGQEENGGESGGQEGRNDPRGGDLGDGTLLPAPAEGRLSSNTSTSEGSNNGLGSRNRHTSNGSNSKENSGSDLSTSHGEHKSSRHRLEGVEGEDTTLDSSSDSGSESNGTQELSETGQNTSLPHLQRSRSHGRGI